MARFLFGALFVGLAILGPWAASAEDPPDLIDDGVPPAPAPPAEAPLPPPPEVDECPWPPADRGVRSDGSGGLLGLAPGGPALGPAEGVPLVGVALAATGLAGVGTGVLGARWFRRADQETSPTEAEAEEEPSLEQLAHTVEAKPMDPLANYRLAVALHAQGSADESVRHLDRALRLEPALIVHFLNDPAASELRRREDVHQMLRDHQRELNRRLWSGYA